MNRDEELADLAQPIKAGGVTGHVPMACNECGQIIMLESGRKQRRCALSPRCKGTYEPLT